MTDRMVKLSVEYEMTEDEVRQWAELDLGLDDGRLEGDVTVAARDWVAAHPEQRSPREVVEALIEWHDTFANGGMSVDGELVIRRDDLRRVLAELQKVERLEQAAREDGPTVDYPAMWLDEQKRRIEAEEKVEHLERWKAELPPEGHVAVHLPVEDAEFWKLDVQCPSSMRTALGAACRDALDRAGSDR